MKTFLVLFLCQALLGWGAYASTSRPCTLSADFAKFLQDVYGFGPEICGPEYIKEMARMTELSIRDLPRIETTDLDNFPALTSLHLLGVDGAQLDQTLFAGRGQITALEILVEANGERIPADLFHFTPQLRNLSLDVQHVPASTLALLFRGLGQLEKLYLNTSTDKGVRDQFPVGIFRNLQSLTNLSIGSTAIFGPGVMAGLGRVKTFGLSGSTQILPGAFSGLSQVTKATINYSQQSIGPGVFADLPELNELELYGRLGELRAGVFQGMPKLTSLQLGGQISSLDQGRAFAGLEGLQSLRITGLKRADQVYFGPSLDLLSPAMFASLTSLKTLDLRDDDIESVPAEAFVGLPHLELLDLNRNVITSVDENVFAPENFRSESLIYLGYSQLSPDVQARIKAQHGNRVFFDCGLFPWEGCPVP